jgi:hypothetical protein
LLIEHYGIKADGRINEYLHAFLTLVLDGGEWSASLPDCFIQEEAALVPTGGPQSHFERCKEKR